jgi:phosphate transport system permease protein
VALPAGLLTAVYLSEYAPAQLRRIVRPTLEILAGVPTVVYGYFALQFVTPMLQRFVPGLAGFNALSPGIVMGIMILPLVSSLSEDALSSVPVGLREGAYALGATKAKVATKVVFPAALSGIVASIILASSRAIGETMIVLLAAGNTPNLTFNPLESIQTMTAFIATTATGDIATGTITYKTVFAVALLLFAMTLVMNLLSIRLVRKYREVYE